jgi:nucleoside-diphosphate-sugar epimerase
MTHPSLQVARGDVLDPAAVEKVVPEHDTVLCSIGAGAGRTTLREDGTRNIVRVMEKAGVRRLICQSSLGLGDSRAHLGFFTKCVIVPVFLRHAFADHECQEAVFDPLAQYGA